MNKKVNKANVTVMILAALMTAFAEGNRNGVFAQSRSLVDIDPLEWNPQPSSSLRIITPRTKTQLINFQTRGGQGRVNISFRLPSNVPTTAFEQYQTSGSAASGNTTASAQPANPNTLQVLPALQPAAPDSLTLKFKGCETGCPNDFTVTVSAKDSGNRTVSQDVIFTLTRARRKPRITSATLTGGGKFGRTEFRIGAEAETYSDQDSGSEIIAVYPGNFRYFIGRALGVIAVPRLGRERNAQLLLKNPYGESEKVSVTLSADPNESLPLPRQRPPIVVISIVTEKNGPFSFSRSHAGALPESGSDDLAGEWTHLRQSCINCSTSSGSVGLLPCGQVGAVYNESRLFVLNELIGKATVTVEPRKGELLGTGQKIRVKWEHGPIGNADYEFDFSIFLVEGVCQDRRR